MMTRTQHQSPTPPNRPDTWVESLTPIESANDPLTSVCATLAQLVRDFGVSKPRVLLGHGVGNVALDELRKATGLPLHGIDSFDLTGQRDCNGEPISFPSADDWRDADGIICLDEKPASYLNAIQFAYDHDLAMPILANVETLPGQFCQLGIAAGTTNTDIFIYNYFTRLYRVKDPLQLVWRAHWRDGKVTRGTRIMGPNANVRYDQSTLGRDDSGVGGTMIYEVRHPAFARVPNNRFRAYVDVVGETFCSTLHGDEIEAKRADQGAWFDTHAALVGGGHDVTLVVRNDWIEPGNLTVEVSLAPATSGVSESSPKHLVNLNADESERELSIAELFGVEGSPQMYEVLASVSGRSYRLEWRESWKNSSGGTCYVSNHGSTNGQELRSLVGATRAAAEPDETLLAQLRVLGTRDVMVLPYPLPVLPASSPLEFSFSAGKFLPRIDHMDAAAFDRRGNLIGRDRLSLPADLGYVRGADTPFADAFAEEGGLLLVSPPYVENEMITYQNCREDLWIRLSDRASGESDMSEFQLHNRNLRGYTVPIGFGQAPQMIKARTELMIRFRLDERFDSRLLLINTSPELDFDKTGTAELEFNFSDGRTYSTEVEIAPHCWLFESVSTWLPEGDRSESFGWVRVVSDSVALAAYAALVERNGSALGFQHLLGA